MYLVIQEYKKGKYGGKYLLDIYTIKNNIPVDITKDIAKEFNLKINNGKIIFIHGSGTGFMRIQEILKFKNVYLLN